MPIHRHALILALAGLLVLGSVAVVPMAAQAAVNVDIRIAPPAPRIEVVPAPRAGYVWAPGYWRWRGHHHVWVGGHWIRERHGYHWVPDTWEPAGPGWHYHRGYWAR